MLKGCVVGPKKRVLTLRKVCVKQSLVLNQRIITFAMLSIREGGVKMIVNNITFRRLHISKCGKEISKIFTLACSVLEIARISSFILFIDEVNELINCT